MTDILNMSNSKRRLVFKYGGPNIEYGYGGRAVYCLEGNGKKAKETVELGMEQIKLGHSWIIQEFDGRRYSARWLNKEGELVSSNHVAARMMIFYRRIEGLDTEMFAGIATNRPNHWKAAGSPDSIVQVLVAK